MRGRWWWVTLRKTWLVLLLAVAVAVYVLMYIGYAAHWGWLDAVDSSTLDVLYRYGTAHPGWVSFWNVFCTVLGPTAFRLLALVVVVVALVRRQLRVALFVAISVGLSGFVAEAAKAVADRPRPATALVSAPSTSFPSGHAVGVMVGVLALWTVALPMVRRSLRGWVIALGVLVVLAIGFGRVALNVHYPSDVLAGWALGYLYYAACLLVLARTPVRATAETPEAPGSAR
jgi:undecaprenyl-diphosphatase